MPTSPITITDIARWNDALAREHDIDDYYARSSFLIRYIEHRRLTCIRNMIDAKPDEKILEVGCGGGHVLQLFPESDLTGVDVSDEMLRKARRNLDGYQVRLLKGELHDLDLPEAGFDKIVCTEVLEHVVDPEAILAWIKRLVRPGGPVVITFPNDPLVNRLKDLIRRCGLMVLPPFHRISWGGDKYHLHVWRVGHMRELLLRDFVIARERFVPSRLLPVRCCFLCTAKR